MSTPEQPPRSSDGPSESPDNGTPEGILLARYHMSVLVTAEFLRSLEKLCWKLGASREQFDHEIFAKGVETITSVVDHSNDEEFQADLAMISPLGALARKGKGAEW